MKLNNMKTFTNLRKTNKKSVALSSVIPREIMTIFNLNEGDKLAWVIEAVDNNLQVRVEKHEEES